MDWSHSTQARWQYYTTSLNLEPRGKRNRGRWRKTRQCDQRNGIEMGTVGETGSGLECLAESCCGLRPRRNDGVDWLIDWLIDIRNGTEFTKDLNDDLKIKIIISRSKELWSREWHHITVHNIVKLWLLFCRKNVNSVCVDLQRKPFTLILPMSQSFWKEVNWKPGLYGQLCFSFLRLELGLRPKRRLCRVAGKTDNLGNIGTKTSELFSCTWQQLLHLYLRSRWHSGWIFLII